MANEDFKVEYLESIIDSMSDMVRVINKEGRVSFTNKSYDRKLATGKSSRGKRCFEIYDQITECDFCMSREVLQTGRTQQTTRKHNNRVYSVTASPIKDALGETVSVVETFRDMTLDYNIKQNLLSQNAKMQKDLQLARSLQQALVKNILPSAPGYEFYSGFFPCEAVGGDIFDCMQFGDKMVMYVADVSGHGVMPAMLSVFFSRVVRAACSLGKTLPSEIFSYVQNEFLRLNLVDSIYITGFLVMLDLQTNTFAYSNAGFSVVPVLFDGEIKELYMSSPPISRWFENPDYRDEFGEFNEGSRLLLYSDGIHNIHQDEDVKNRLYDLFSLEDFECDEFVGSVKRELHTRPEDDLTLFICRKLV